MRISSTTTSATASSKHCLHLHQFLTISLLLPWRRQGAHQQRRPHVQQDRQHAEGNRIREHPDPHQPQRVLHQLDVERLGRVPAQRRRRPLLVERSPLLHRPDGIDGGAVGDDGGADFAGQAQRHFGIDGVAVRGAEQLGEGALQGSVPGEGLGCLVVGHVDLEEAGRPLAEEEDGFAIEECLELVVIGDEEVIGELGLEELELGGWGNEGDDGGRLMLLLLLL